MISVETFGHLGAATVVRTILSSNPSCAGDENRYDVPRKIPANRKLDVPDEELSSGQHLRRHLPWRSVSRFVTFSIGATVVLWLSLEAVFGLLEDDRESVPSKIQFVTMTSRDFIVADRDRGFRLRPNFSSPTLHINSLGFRGQELPADLADKRLILALGESTTFGWAVADDETYPGYLEGILNSSATDRRTVVVNAAVPSYSSQQVYLYAEQLLSQIRPQVVLVSILWNDLFYSSLEDWTPQSLLPLYPSRLQRTLIENSPFCRWLTRKPAGPERIDFFSQDALAEYKSNVGRIVRLCRSKGVDVLFVEPPLCEHLISPTGETMWKNRFSRDFVPQIADIFLAAQIEELESQQVPLIRHPLGISARSTSESFLDFLHPDRDGNKLIAQSVAAYLQEELPEKPQ